MPADNKFELCCNRPECTKRYPNRRDCDKPPEAILLKQLQYNQESANESANNKLLNSKSRAVIDGLNERRWALMYLQHLATRVGQTDTVELNLSDLPDLEALSLNNSQNTFPPSLVYDSSPEAHIEVLEQRRIDAQIVNKAGWAALDTLALGLASDIRNCPEDNNIAFRVFDDYRKARFFPDRQDIRCGNWQNFDINRTPIRDEAEKHIEYFMTPTDYISMSTSPGRIWNIASSRAKNSVKATQKIAVIDLRVLKRLGIAHGSTTEDLGFRHWNKTYGTGTEFATKHHVLVLGWLPSRSIAGVLSMEQFEKLLGQSQIDVSGHSKSIPLSEYEKKIDFESISKALYEKGASAWCKDLLKLPV